MQNLINNRNTNSSPLLAATSPARWPSEKDREESRRNRRNSGLSLSESELNFSDDHDMTSITERNTLDNVYNNYINRPQAQDNFQLDASTDRNSRNTQENEKQKGNEFANNNNSLRSTRVMDVTYF